MKNKTLLTLILVGIVAVCSLALGISMKGDPATQAGSLAKTELEVSDEILALCQAGAYVQAYQQAILALESDPQQAKVALQAGHLAVLLKKPESAAEYMRRAWDLGEKKLSAMLVMVNDLEGDRSEKIAFFDKLFASLEQSPAHLNGKARFYSQIGEHQEALLIWQALHEEDPAEGLVLQIARKLEMMGKRAEAIAFLFKQQKREHLSDEGMNMLVSLLIFDNQVEKASEIAEAYEAEDPHGEWQLKMVVMKILGGDLPAAHASLELLKDKGTEHPVAITVAHEARILLALMRVIIQQDEANFDDLRQIANQDIQRVPLGTLPTPLLGLRVSQKQIEGERLLYQFLQQSLRDESVENVAFARVSSLISDSPVVNWLGIRYFLAAGKPATAVAIHQSLEAIHPLASIEGLAGCFYKSPLFLVEVARAYEMNGQASLALAILSHLHQRGTFTPDSILLYSKVGDSVDQDYDASNVERVLDERFKNDLNYQFRKIGKNLQKNHYARALEQIRPLAKSNAANIELQMVYFMALVSQNLSEELSSELAQSQLPERSKVLVQARFEMKNGNEDKAEQLFKQAMDEDGYHGYLDYARFLVLKGSLHQAEKLYKNVLDFDPENLTAMHGVSIVYELNGKLDEAFATLRQAGELYPRDSYTFKRLAKLYLQKNKASDALWEVEKVLHKDPDDPNAIALKVVALTQLALEQSIKLLQKSKLDEVGHYLRGRIDSSPENPQLGLQLYLAAAYRDHGYSQEATRIYQNMLELSPAVWAFSPFKRGDIEVALQMINK
ncbi:MAG: tetratricopeptide repeat protein [Rubritalea sp.]|uniref:tetratricopeptide repeat protein n=1 Tax=Rubritalea sp. TaxID=2109375 RepID=UPI003241C188